MVFKIQILISVAILIIELLLGAAAALSDIKQSAASSELSITNGEAQKDKIVRLKQLLKAKEQSFVISDKSANKRYRVELEHDSLTVMVEHSVEMDKPSVFVIIYDYEGDGIVDYGRLKTSSKHSQNYINPLSQTRGDKNYTYWQNEFDQVLSSTLLLMTQGEDR